MTPDEVGDDTTAGPGGAVVTIDGVAYEPVDVCADASSDGTQVFAELEGPDGGWYLELWLGDDGTGGATLHEHPEVLNSLFGGDVRVTGSDGDLTMVEGEVWGDGDTRWELSLALPVETAAGCRYALAYEVETASSRGDAEDEGISWDLEFPQLVATDDEQRDVVDRANAAIYQNLAVEDLPPSPYEDDPDYDGPAWSRWLRYETDLETPSLLAFSYTDDLYTGGAHGNPMVGTLLLDLRTGEPIDVQDLFEADLATTLSADVNAALDEQFGEDGHEATETVLEDVAWVATVTPTDLVIRIQTYQVGPFAIGSPEVRLGLIEVAERLRPTEQLREALSWTVG